MYLYSSSVPPTECYGGELYIYNNNNNNIYLLQLGCNPVAVVILHVYKTWNWLLLNLSGTTGSYLLQHRYKGLDLFIKIMYIFIF